MKMKMTYYLGPLDNPSHGSALMLWAPSSPPCQQEGVTE
jgi:hypothetical protein